MVVVVALHTNQGRTPTPTPRPTLNTYSFHMLKVLTYRYTATLKRFKDFRRKPCKLQKKYFLNIF